MEQQKPGPAPTNGEKKTDAKGCISAAVVLVMVAPFWVGGAWLLHRAATTSWLSSFLLTPVLLLMLFIAGLRATHTPAGVVEVLLSPFRRRDP